MVRPSASGMMFHPGGVSGISTGGVGGAGGIGGARRELRAEGGARAELRTGGAVCVCGAARRGAGDTRGLPGAERKRARRRELGQDRPLRSELLTEAELRTA